MRRELLHPTQRAALCRKALVVTAFLATGLWARRLGIRRVVVVGESMQPGFQPGDRLVLGPAWRARAGQVVAVADPRQPNRILIKRIRSIDGSTIDVRGDNATASTDSREFGPVPRSAVVGRVAYRYAPPGRTGWWPP